MNLQAEKLSLIQELINLNDKELLLKIKSILKKSSKTAFKPMDIETFFAKIDASEKAYQKGEIISQSVLEKEISTWKRKK
ncbi:MAG: hypothetical protein ABIT08_00570 [Bacteroidia bacterium]